MSLLTVMGILGKAISVIGFGLPTKTVQFILTSKICEYLIFMRKERKKENRYFCTEEKKYFVPIYTVGSAVTVSSGRGKNAVTWENYLTEFGL